jgi:DNA gyrase subunit A
LRVFAGRDSSGVRGMKVAQGDEVMSLAVLRHMPASPDERAAFLKLQSAKRRQGDEEIEAAPADAEDAPEAEVTLSPERIAELEGAEEFLLTVTDAGFGKRSSAYDYRVTGRGGQGIANLTLAPRNGRAVAATFPVRAGDDVMLVTDAGRLIRVPGDQVRVTGRQSMGVTLFRLDADEHVTSVFPVLEEIVADDGGDAPEPTAEEPGDGEP